MRWSVMTIADAEKHTRIPAGTIRRWLAEDRLRRFGVCKPYRIDVVEAVWLRDTLKRGHLPNGAE